MPFDYDDGSPRRPQPGTIASTGQILKDVVKGQRQQERQIIDQRPERRTSSSSTFYFSEDFHGPGGDVDHTFSFSIPGIGVWSAQITYSVESDAVGAAALYATVSGDTPTVAHPPVSLTGGEASDTVIALINSTGTGVFDVDLSLTAAGSPTSTFVISVTAFRLSTS